MSGTPEQAGEAPDLICSAKGCRNDADWGLLWANPRIHTGSRRKTWLACTDHREHLAGFLAARSFLHDVVPVAELDA
ncbi:hypothetical protein [Georgenia wangjunii]|uniref:hypothetical protein n=1 Tax=Georgenia wangjunii TaxID=3117730 RepID=UPI002F268FB6